MQASRARVEIIRFGLLITMTLALVTVAHRATSDHSGTSAAGTHPTHSQSQSASNPASPPASSRGSSSGGGTANNGGGSSSATGDNGGGTANNGGSSATDSGASSGSGTSGGTVDVPTLPRTGPTNVAVLVACGFVLIGGGALSLTWSRLSARSRPSTPGTR